MFDISPIQLIMVLVIAVMVLGPTKLPQFTRAMGKGLRELKGALGGDIHDAHCRAGRPRGHRGER
jgi:sec-independent protein translocase protein TatA